MDIPIGRSLIGLALSFLVAFAAADAHAEGNSALSDQLETDGPWTYNNNPGGEDGKAIHIATTQSRERTGVWLGFTCGEDHRIFASILDQSSFAAAIGDEVSVEIALDSSSAGLDAMAKKTSETVLTFNPTLSKNLFIYAIHAKALKTTFSDQEQGLQTYSFRLQPNSMAFREIIDTCLPQQRGRPL